LRGQSGQALPIIAIFSGVLLGASALAVDLSVQTHRERSLQNIGDSAALVGALDLTSSPVPQSQRTAAVEDAFVKLHNELQYYVSGTVQSYVATMVTTGLCSGAKCWANCPSSATACTVELLSSGYDMVVSTPPVRANNPVDAQDLNVEVIINQPTTNQLGSFVGVQSGNPGSHSIAYHRPPNQHNGFALLAQSFVQSGNSGEIITGNVYASQYLNPQDSGQSFICAQGGSLVLGAPQHPNEPSGYDTQQTHVPMPSTARQVSFVNGKSGTGTKTCTSDPPAGGSIAQTLGEGCSNIPNVTLPARSYVDDSTYVPAQTVPGGGSFGNLPSPGTLACVAYPSITAPALQAPSPPHLLPAYYCSPGNTGLGSDGLYHPGEYTCQLVTGTHALAPGVYVIIHTSGNPTPDVDISTSLPSSCSASEQAQGFATCLDGVTFDLATDPSHTTPPTLTADSGGNINQTPFCPSPRLSAGDCVYTVYAAPGVGATTTTTKPFTAWAMTGTVYMPTGTVSMGQNTRVQITGQAIVNRWSDQSGFKPNPGITYNANAAAPLPEVLRLAE